MHLGQRTCQVREHGSNNVLLTICLHPLGSLGTSLQDVERPRTRCLNFFFKAGGFYVDKTCIDCDTCRWMVPATFARVGEQSAVTAQPATAEQRHAALQVGCGTCRHVGEQQVVTKRSKESTTFPHPLPQALLACPTFSIHCIDRRPGELKAAQESFPLPIPGCPSVFHTGFAAESSFGATAYFIRRPQVWRAAWLPLLLMQVAASRLRAFGRRALSQQLVASQAAASPALAPRHAPGQRLGRCAALDAAASTTPGRTGWRPLDFPDSQVGLCKAVWFGNEHSRPAPGTGQRAVHAPRPSSRPRLLPSSPAVRAGTMWGTMLHGQPTLGLSASSTGWRCRGGRAQSERTCLVAAACSCILWAPGRRRWAGQPVLERQHCTLCAWSGVQ